MAKVKTAISIDESLFREAERRAKNLGISRSAFYSKALAKLIRDEESREILARLNESYAVEPDEEEEAYLRRMMAHHAKLLDETGNEWNPRER